MGQKKILLVDDEPEICDLLAGEMRLLGYAPTICHSGHSATKLIEQTPFDLVITDVRMPDGTGTELLAHIRKKDSKKPPVILLSGYADLTIEDAKSKGAYTLLSKPLPLVEIIKVVQKALGD